MRYIWIWGVSIAFSLPLLGKRIYDYDWKHIYRQGEEHLKRKRYYLALFYFSKAYRKGGDKDPSLLNALGRVYNLLGKKEEAVFYYKKSLKKKPLQKEPLYFLSHFYWEEKDFKKAAHYFERYISLGEYDPLSFLYYALSLCEIGEREKAISFLKEKSTPFSYKECLEKEKKKEYLSALSCYKKVLFLNLKDPISFRNYIRILLILKKEEEAYKYAYYMHLLFSDKKKEHLPYLLLSYTLRKYQAYKKELLELIKKFPKEPLWYYLLGEFFLERGDTSSSEKYFYEAKSLSKEAK